MEKEKRNRFVIFLSSIFGLVAISIIVLGVVFYQTQAKELENQSKKYLSFSTTIKSTLIKSWLNERRNDVQILATNSALHESINEYILLGLSDDIKNNLHNILNSIFKGGQYESILVANEHGKILYSLGDNDKTISQESKKYLTQSLKTNQIYFSGFFKNSIENKVLINFYLPINNSTKNISRSALILRIDPENHLFPLLETHLDPESEIDFFLLRKNQMGLLYLNHRDSLNKVELSTSLLVDRIMEDKNNIPDTVAYIEDYRKEKILASICKIPDTPWVIMAKVDSTRIFQPLQKTSVGIIAFIVLLITITGTSIGYVWTKSNEQQFKKYYKAEQEKNEALYRYNFLLQHANDAILILDPEGKIKEANKKALTIYDYTHEEIVSLSLFDLVPDQIKEKVKGRIEDLINEKNLIYESLHLRKDKTEFPVEISAGNIRVGDAQYLQAIVRDITDRKIAEYDLIKAKEKAEESNQLKSEFLAQMSHEIRSPLNIILGSISIIHDKTKDSNDAESEELFVSLKSASKRIMKTVDAILNMSELHVGTYEADFHNINIADNVLSQIFLEYKLSATEKNLDLKLEINTTDAYATVDSYSVTQIISNLIDNAIKYTSVGYVMLRVFRNNEEKLVVEIEDTGIGISKEFLPNIFDVFRQEIQGYTRTYEGNGLGLALVKKYCELNNITIEVESEKGKGSIFRLIFNN